ncbi:unnamed protein product [Schistocephalus solidus]|uniref:Wiskott-Aldrich syndrome protein family member 2-like n=1 Tax=Schistocephalus solidus TaxID=70667 RepID=A0A183TF42_SCHSO|nr:unnamed protein product [Schistocephalus solidus]
MDQRLPTAKRDPKRYLQGKKTFRIQRETREEVVSVDRLKAAVPDTTPDEHCGSLPSGSPPPPPSIPPSLIFPLPLSPHPPTATSSSSTTSPQLASHTHSSPVPPLYGQLLVSGPRKSVCRVSLHGGCFAVCQRLFPGPSVFLWLAGGDPEIHMESIHL